MLQVEHGIKSLSTILMKHLTSLDQMWQKCLPLATFAYNIFNSTNLANLETTPDIKVPGTFKDYYYLLKQMTSIFCISLL